MRSGQSKKRIKIKKRRERFKKKKKKKKKNTTKKNTRKERRQQQKEEGKTIKIKRNMQGGRETGSKQSKQKEETKGE